MAGWVDCSQPLTVNTPKMSFLPEPRFEEVSQLSATKPKVSMLHICTHIGTHIDAPSHFIEGGKDIGDYPADRFLLEGVVWRTPARELSAVTLEDLQGLQVRPGDAVFLYTGWGDRYQDPVYYEHPFLDEEAARWLVEQGASLVGIDFLTPDKPPQLRGEDFNSPIHRILLGNEVLIIENLTGLAPLAGRRVEVVAPPLYIREKVEASPARVLARAVD